MTGINFKNISFSLDKENWFIVLAIVLSIAYVKIFNLNEIYENTLLENFQLIPLIASFVLCTKAKKYKNFFKAIAIVVVFMFLRELSYGRTIFCLMPGDPYNTYPWSHYKYGFLVNYIVGAALGLSALWFIIKKVYLETFEILKTTILPFWTFFASFGLVAIQLISEKTLHSTIIEEISEFGLYFGILALVLIYRKQLEKNL